MQFSATKTCFNGCEKVITDGLSQGAMLFTNDISMTISAVDTTTPTAILSIIQMSTS
jgi:hypothetical protein